MSSIVKSYWPILGNKGRIPRGSEPMVQRFIHSPFDPNISDKALTLSQRIHNQGSISL